jgi:hypothetical protein
MRRRAEAKINAVIAVVGFPGRAEDGSDTEWLLSAEGDMMSAGNGSKAFAIATAAIQLLSKETTDIPAGKQLHDQHTRQWMIEIAVHKAAINLGVPYLSVSMHYLIETTSKWNATIAETARQLLKHGALPKDVEKKPSSSKTKKEPS